MKKWKDEYCASLEKDQGEGHRLVSLPSSSGTVFEEICLKAISRHS